MPATPTPGVTLKIVRIKAKGKKGKPRNEFVTIKNTSKADVPLKGYSLQDRTNKRIKLPGNYTLKRDSQAARGHGLLQEAQEAHPAPGPLLRVQEAGPDLG